MVSDSAEEFDQKAADLVAAIEAKKPKKRDFSYTQNRELSWLQFNRRVLEEALDPKVPLLERIKFISIFCTNLDEFFMVRVGSITDLSIIAPEERENKSNMTPVEQLDAIFAAVKPLIKERDEIYAQVTKDLKKYGFKEVDMVATPKKQRKFARDYYRDFIRPVLSPQVVDERHPFPHLKNKELYVVTVLSEGDGSQHLGIIPVPENISPIIVDPDNPLRFVRAEKLIAYYIHKIFDIYEVSEPSIIAVTRNADISFDEEKFSDDEGDYRLHVSRLLKKRNRLNPVRLEIEGKADKALINSLLKRLKLTKKQAFTMEAPINLGWVFGLEKRLDAGQKVTLCYPPFVPRASEEFNLNESIFEQVKERDRILFYPYDSMDPFLRMLQEAAYDPTVLSIKITVYRLADDSRVAQHLVEAAENGKEVTVLMELRARFDEANNIDWAGRLEEAGCNIIYGMENYKCHSKVCLITRQDNGRVTNITQIGTGNYNEKTARLYTDLSLITADEAIGRDAVTFFQNLLIGNLNGDYEKLLVAPSGMKKPLLKLIDREIAKGEKGRITLKANSVTERDIIDRLAEASRAGVQVRMNIRGICCQLPGVEGKTENIHVRSIVGQFLEHSRIYIFGEGDDLKMFIGSADLMTRNLVHRVEVACPVTDPAIRSSILLFMEKIFEDNCKARSLGSDGEYSFVDKAYDADLFAHEGRFCLQEWCIDHPLQGAAPAESAVQEALPLEEQTSYVMGIASVTEAELEAVPESDIDEVIQSLSSRDEEPEEDTELDESVGDIDEPEDESEELESEEEPEESEEEPELEPAEDEAEDDEAEPVEEEEEAEEDSEEAAEDAAGEATDEAEEEAEAEEEPEADTEVKDESLGLAAAAFSPLSAILSEGKSLSEAEAVLASEPEETSDEPESAEEPQAEEEAVEEETAEVEEEAETEGESLDEEPAESGYDNTLGISFDKPESEDDQEPAESGYDNTLGLSFDGSQSEDGEEVKEEASVLEAATEEATEPEESLDVKADDEAESEESEPVEESEQEQGLKLDFESESSEDPEPESEPSSEDAGEFVLTFTDAEPKPAFEEKDIELGLEDEVHEEKVFEEKDIELGADDEIEEKDIEFGIEDEVHEEKVFEEKDIELGLADDEEQEVKPAETPELDTELSEKLNGILSSDVEEKAELESKLELDSELEEALEAEIDDISNFLNDTKDPDAAESELDTDLVSEPDPEPQFEYETKKTESSVIEIDDKKLAKDRAFASGAPHIPAKPAEESAEMPEESEEKPAEEPKKEKRKGFFARWFS